MKTKSLLKAALVTVMFLGLGWSAEAQLDPTKLVEPTGTEATDSVTVGSTVLYRLKGDPNMHLLRSLGILDFSKFTKVTSDGETIYKADGSTPVADADSSFSVKWTDAGSRTVSVTEVPQPKATMPAYSCTANTVILPVVVLARPTAAWNGEASASGCSVDNTTVTIPYTLTGTGKFDVKYKIVYTNLAGTISNVVAAGTELKDLGKQTHGSQDFNFSYAVPKDAYGKYEVHIENVTDRISRKSGVTTSQSTDLPSVLTFYAYPTPVTQPVNHIKNM